MADDEEYDYETTLTFEKSKYFWKFLNRQMIITDVESLNDSFYRLVLFSAMPDNFQDNCIDPNTGCMDYSDPRLVTITDGFEEQRFSVGIRWLDNGTNGFSIYVDEDVDIPIDDGVTLWVKGVALVKRTATMTGDDDYVVAFATLSTRAECQNAISIVQGSEFVGHSSCKVI